MIINFQNIPRTHEDISRLLHEKGELSVEFKIKNKRKLKRAIDNVYAVEKARRDRKSLSGKVKYLFVLIANCYYQVFAGTNDKGVDLAITIATGFWQQIESIGGENVDDKMGKITFYARK
ncbi:hypothetical protein A3715_03695 [Oleiphilus sp. HI0009]|nr:hypothetical protein A3715_22350 [Oleiphilus sp. HI0009]KZX85437.1 hypothetical protein A3715_03695 [Oleiphilus sp. HI0009]